MCLQQKPTRSLTRQENSRGLRPAPPSQPGGCTRVSQTQSSHGAPTHPARARLVAAVGFRTSLLRRFCAIGIGLWNRSRACNCLRLSCRPGPEARLQNSVLVSVDGSAATL